jgi:hypothetical protein
VLQCGDCNVVLWCCGVERRERGVKRSEEE